MGVINIVIFGFQMSGISNRTLSPVNWYINNGYEPGMKGNPVFAETGSEVPYMAYDTTEQPKHRTVFSDINEEDDKNKTNDEKKGEARQQTDTLRRLNQVYVDVEPNYSRVSIPENRMFVSELDAEMRQT